MGKLFRIRTMAVLLQGDTRWYCELCCFSGGHLHPVRAGSPPGRDGQQ